MQPHHGEPTAATASAINDASPSVEELIEMALPSHSNKLSDMVRPMARDLIAQIAPQDAAERMLTVQIIANFHRSIFLALNSNRQKHPRWFTLYSSECDRVMNTFRRQIQTLTDLRRPRRTSFTAIRKANIAAQQIVMNDETAAALAADAAVLAIETEAPVLPELQPQMPRMNNRAARVPSPLSPSAAEKIIHNRAGATDP